MISKNTLSKNQDPNPDTNTAGIPGQEHKTRNHAQTSKTSISNQELRKQDPGDSKLQPMKLGKNTKIVFRFRISETWFHDTLSEKYSTNNGMVAISI